MRKISPVGVSLTAAAAALGCAFQVWSAPVSWTDGTSFWDVATNWDAGLPGIGDDAFITLSGARTVTVRATGGPFSVNSVTTTGENTLTLVNGGSLDLTGAATSANATGISSLARLTQNAGSTLSGSSQVVVTGPASLGQGLQTGSGTTVLKGASSVSGLLLDAGRVLRNEGSVTLTGGMNLNPTNATGFGRIENAAGALFDVRTFNLSITASQFAGDTGAGAAIDNAGVFRKSTGNGYSVNVPFNNLAGGTIDLQAGSFSFNAGGSYSGAVTLAAGTTLNFGAGTHSVHAGASFAGAGTLALSGTPTVLDLLEPTSVQSAFSMSGGTVSGADLTLDGPVDIGISSSLGVMSGAHTTLFKGTSRVGGGANNPFGLDAGRVLRNEGEMVVTGVLNLNRLDTTGAGRIENAAGALIDVRTFNQSIVATDWSASNAADNGADALVSNAGTFRKGSGGGYFVDVPFHNLAGGMVDVQMGSFAFNAGSTQNGAVQLAAGTSLTLGGGTHSVGAGASFAGPGTLSLAGAATVLDLGAATSIDSAFAMTGGTIRGAQLTLNGPATLTISSSLGVMSGPAATILKGASTLSGGPNNAFGLDAGRVLRNEGQMTITGVLNLNRLDATGSGRIENAAGALIDVRTFNQSIFATDWRASNPLDTGADARVDNAGVFRKSGRLGYSVLVPFFNTGRVEVVEGSLNVPTFSNAGTVDVAAGTTFSAGTSFVNTGRIEGSGTVVVPASGLVNAGTIAPGHSPGELHIQGGLVMDPAGVIEIELAGAADFDRIVVSGDASLDGELAVLRLPGYTPRVGDSFLVLSSAARSGEFATTSFHDFGGTVFSVVYGDKTVTLNVTAVPEPETWLLLLAGLVVVGAAQRGSRPG